MKEKDRKIETGCMYMNAGICIGMQCNRILKISRTMPLTGSPTDGTMLTNTTKLVRWDAMQRT